MKVKNTEQIDNCVQLKRLTVHKNHHNFSFSACMLQFQEIQMKVGQWQCAKVRHEHETHGLQSDI